MTRMASRMEVIEGLVGTVQEDLGTAIEELEKLWGSFDRFQWEHHRRSFMTWEDLKIQLIQRFRPLLVGFMYCEFLTLKQEGLVREYLKKFELLASSLDGISEKIIDSTFTNWLNPDIGHKVKVLGPSGLEKVMKLAQTVESKMLAQQKS
ncbi:hypothetical protein G4B88_027892 [Cannabis sativa]|uniref:Retrotransposon gag domain-containing protein n=1 Tax=Cannabis sativa TaxID=3483 RepID=A0A7J6I7V0_CANSA|nr:hypothetical protein G4B88_027892 [Cannabis sativa]